MRISDWSSDVCSSDPKADGHRDFARCERIRKRSERPQSISNRTIMASTHHTKMLILGSGPAGLSAAIYAARAGMQPIVVQGLQPGGQLTITTDVENYPGFAEVIQGPWLMEQMTAQAVHVGTSMIWDTIVDVDLSERPFRSEEHTSELQSLMRISYAVFCLKKKNTQQK